MKVGLFRRAMRVPAHICSEAQPGSSGWLRQKSSVRLTQPRVTFLFGVLLWLGWGGGREEREVGGMERNPFSVPLPFTPSSPNRNRGPQDGSAPERCLGAQQRERSPQSPHILIEHL